jgi:hypothetical protein
MSKASKPPPPIKTYVPLNRVSPMEENTDDEGAKNELEGSDMALEETATALQSPESVPEPPKSCLESAAMISDIEMGEALSSVKPLETEIVFPVSEQITASNQKDVQTVHSSDSMKESAIVQCEEQQGSEVAPIESFPLQTNEQTPAVVAEDPTVDGNFKVLSI